MANSYLLEIGMNDSQQDVIRKCNNNFKLLALSQTKQNRSEVRQESVRTDVKIDTVVKAFTDTLESTVKQMNQLFTEKVEEAVQKSYPPIGSYIYCDFDPNVTYNNTHWDQIDEGMIVVSSGKNYTAGQQYHFDRQESTGNDNTIALPLWHRIS